MVSAGGAGKHRRCRRVIRNHSLRNVARCSAEDSLADDDYARANPSKRCGVCDSSVVEGEMYRTFVALGLPINQIKWVQVMRSGD